MIWQFGILPNLLLLWKTVKLLPACATWFYPHPMKLGQQRLCCEEVVHVYIEGELSMPRVQMSKQVVNDSSSVCRL
jgi:hypothetical protein